MEHGLLDRLSSLVRSENAKLTLCAICASLLTATAIYGCQSTSRRHQQQQLHDRVKEEATLPHETILLNAAGGARQGSDMSEELIQEQLSRNYLFFGEEGMQKIRGSFVVVVGVGGVGSWATTMLVRSGVGKVRIIDFDQVTLSSLNRHAVATLADVGTPKVRALETYLKSVAPWIEIDSRNALFQKSDAADLLQPWHHHHSKSHDASNADSSLLQMPDFVIDAIDNIETKADLLEYCHTNHIPVIASMGAGCKSDPTRIFLSDISETSEDPLSRSTRRHLRLRGITTGIPVVYSTEKPGPGKAQLIPLKEELVEDRSEYGILPDFRARILPVLGTMPAIFGLTLVTYVLTTISGYPTSPVRGKNRKSLYESAFRDLSKYADQKEQRIPLTVDDIGFLIEEVADGRSCLPPHFPQRLTLVKFYPDLPLTLSNTLVVTKEEAKIHETRVLKNGEDVSQVYDQKTLDVIKQKLARFKQLQEIRQGK